MKSWHSFPLLQPLSCVMLVVCCSFLVHGVTGKETLTEMFEENEPEACLADSMSQACTGQTKSGTAKHGG